MKALGPYNPTKPRERIIADNLIAMRGTTKRPEPPRGLMAQSGARKVLLTWCLPISHNDITGWRIYKDTENNLAMEVRDKGTRQMFMDVTSGANPPVVNFFISSMNPLGVESLKVHVQGSATPEAAAPPDPAPPRGFTETAAGGGDTSYRTKTSLLGYSSY